MSRRSTLSRRAFLGGAAVVLTLPWLEAFELESRAAGADGPRRFIAYYAPNGMLASAWTPKTTGPGYSLSPTLAGLEAVQDHILVLSGLDNAACDPGVPGHHAAGTAGFLTAARPRKSESDIHLAASIDQLFADHIAGETPLHSLQLGLEGGGAGVGHCDNGFACAYSRSVAWAGPKTPLPKVVSPRVAFDLLFAGSDPGATAIEQDRRRQLRLSALDSVQADVGDLRKRLGVSDQTRLDEYLESVRALERRVEAPLPECSLDGFDLAALDLPVESTTITARAQLMADLMVLALRCDLTRSITFMLGNSASTRSYPELGITAAHHDLSHHQGDPDKLHALLAIERWEVEQFAYFVERLRDTPDGEGCLLDSCIALMSSELSDSNSHTHTQLPVLLAGSGGGTVVPGRHVVHPPGTAYGDLLLAIVHALGVPAEQIGAGGFEPLTTLVG